MIIWINGAFGSGKTTTAKKLQKMLAGSFIYDPEQVGYFIRRNAPKHLKYGGYGDFQDLPLWRTFNYEMLKILDAKHGEPIIVPMTLVNPDYYDEIIGQLMRDGVDVRHFILYLDKEALVKRLRKRAFGSVKMEKFAVDSIDRCIHSFDIYVTETKVMVGGRKADEIAEEIRGRLT
jgi:hypothetical protein